MLHRIRMIIAWALFFGLGMLSSGCRRAQPWNVLLVTFDTTRADHLGCYGNTEISTPHLDRLAAEGVRFANTMTAVPITAPSHTSILTGRYPIAHGVRDNGLFVLAEEQLTLAEILREHGYATAAAVGAFPLTRQFGLDQGFDFYDDHLTGAFEDYTGERATPKERLFFDERRAAQVNEAILPWLLAPSREPFFAWVHYFDPHQPFEPPPPFDELYANHLYDGEIAYADSRIGFLLDQLDAAGMLDHTLVVMTGDHGEGLGDHNEVTHAVLAYNSTLHVPLIIRPPKHDFVPGTVIENTVSTVDIAPTILDLLQVPVPSGLQGESLTHHWQDARPEIAKPRELYSENLCPNLSHGWGQLRVLFSGGYKYIHGPRPELFDLRSDPDERHNLIASQSEKAAELRRGLQQFLGDHSVAGASRIETIDEETRVRLEALGYLHSAGEVPETISETLEDGGIPPQDRVADINDLSSAKHLLFNGRYAEALVYTEKLVSTDPGNPVNLELHTSALTEVGRLDEAWECLQRLGQRGSMRESLFLRLTALRFEHGSPEAAMASLRDYLATKPSIRAEWLLATILRRSGSLDEARHTLQRALTADPSFVPARVDLAVYLAESGEREDAERTFSSTLEIAPYDPKAHYNYGAFLAADERFEEAIVMFSRSVALAPKYLRAHHALILANLAAGRRNDAELSYAALRAIAPRSQEAVAAEKLLTAR